VTDYLDDIASDLSAIHRISDAGEMEAAVFFSLVLRLPAYQGVLHAVLSREAEGQRTPRNAARRGPAGYGRNSPMANNARAADSAPAATSGQLAALNAQLGSTWFAHKTVTADG
jgi:hypothetical protein